MGGKGTGAEDNIKGYKTFFKTYTDCVEAIPTRKCATALAQMSSTDAYVTAFYSKTGLVLAACEGTVTPSVCPVDMFSKEVSFIGAPTASKRRTRGARRRRTSTRA